MASGWYRAHLVALLAWPLAAAQHVYVGVVEPTAAVIAWGSTGGAGNTIGFASAPLGDAELRIAQQVLRTSERNWLRVENLTPDTDYPYEVLVDGSRLGGGVLRTWPQAADRLVFFVLGDWGTGKQPQHRLARAMASEYAARRQQGDFVRFVLTTGDNIYADTFFGLPWRNSGNQDAHWEKKFFAPYRELLSAVPFYATLGNHDGNESESRGDLPVCLDNFFSPGGKPARYYRFAFGDLAEFFALDSTRNQETGPPRPEYLEDGAQSRWLRESLAASRAAWKIPYFHHPPYTAGPRHSPAREALAHWIRSFEEHNVRVAFHGHEHNFQFTDPGQTGGVTYVVTGSGGQLRKGNIQRRLETAKIAGWAGQHQFLVVEVDRREVRITPRSWEPVSGRGPAGQPAPLPLVIGR